MAMVPKKKPNRTPHITFFLRLDHQIGQVFIEYVKSIRPRTSRTAVAEVAIQQYLEREGVWPKKVTSSPSASH